MNKSKLKLINHLDENEKKWFAIYTKYKCEKFVVNNLLKKKIEAYIPLLQTTKQYTRKIKTYDLPLMNCYAFVKINRSEFVQVLETEYVFKFIKQRKNLISIPEEEINLLKTIVGEYQDSVVLEDKSFKEGQEVEVIAGSLTGLKGNVLSVKNKNQFAVQLDHIGIQLRIDINPGLLRPLNKLVKA